MNQKLHIVALVVITFSTIDRANGATHLFDLNGNAGAGLLPGNENHVINGTPGSGGETGLGISYDDVTNILSMNFAWGSSNGFTNLTGNATAGHIHGATVNSAPTGFSQDAGVLIFLSTLPQWNASSSAGGLFGGSVSLSAAQETELLAQRYYINVHTSANGGGEVRGHLVLIPEPAGFALLASAGIAALTFLRRKRA